MLAVVQATEYDLAEHIAEGVVLVCVTSSSFIDRMRGQRIARRFAHCFISAGHRKAGFKCVEANFNRMSIGIEVLGVTMWKPLPVIVLFKDGVELARKKVLESEATHPKSVERLIAWVHGHLEEAV